MASPPLVAGVGLKERGEREGSSEWLVGGSDVKRGRKRKLSLPGEETWLILCACLV